MRTTKKLAAAILVLAMILSWMPLPGSVPAVYATANNGHWEQDANGWYRIENDARVENSWRKDSHGWCYLGADGYMVTNDWAKDSKGWCWLGADGYMVKATKWIKYDGSWYHITNGYMDASKWMKDSKGWCYLGTDGRMVTDGWAKDSKGWCWLGSDGYMLQKTQWIKHSGSWYHITNGYMDASKWMKDSKGWCYLGLNGKMVTNGWAKDSKGWCWMGEDGYWVSNQWVQSGGAWYYIKDNHYMATGKITLANGTYEFDKSGKLSSIAGHTQHNYISTTVTPTCTEGGYTTHTCSCGASYTDNYTSALGHDWVADYDSVWVGDKYVFSDGYECYSESECAAHSKEATLAHKSVSYKVLDVYEDQIVSHHCSRCGASAPTSGNLTEEGHQHNWVTKTGTRTVTKYKDEPVYEEKPVYVEVKDYERVIVCGVCGEHIGDSTGIDVRSHMKAHLLNGEADDVGNYYSQTVCVGSHLEQDGTEIVQVGTKSVPCETTEAYTYDVCSECGAVK